MCGTEEDQEAPKERWSMPSEEDCGSSEWTGRTEAAAALKKEKNG